MKRKTMRFSCKLLDRLAEDPEVTYDDIQKLFDTIDQIEGIQEILKDQNRDLKHMAEVGHFAEKNFPE